MQQALGFIFVLLSGVGFGFLGIFGRLAFQSGLSVGELLTLRFAVASVVLFFGLLFTKPQLIKLPLRQILISSGLGIFGYAVFSTLYFESIKGISVPLAALLLFTFPIFVNLGSHFILKERLSRAQAVSLIIACLGLGLLVWGPIVINSLTAVLSALAAALSYSIYVLVSGRLQQKVPPLSSSLYVILSGTLALYLFHQPSLSNAISLTQEQYLIILGIAVISTILPMTLFLAGLQKLPSSKASIIVMIEPVVATIAAWILLGEQLSRLQLVGASLVLAALALNAIK